MRTATYQLKDLENLTFCMGYVGENEHRTLRVDCTEAFDEYPDASPALSVAPPRGEPYPAIITMDGNYVEWVITDADLAYSGNGEAQFSFVQDNVVMKTYRFSTRVEKSVMATGTPPNPLEDFIVRADAVLEEVEQAIVEVDNKADKVSGATNGNFAGLDANGNLVDSGKKPSDFLTQHQDISGKADKTDTVLMTTLSRGRKANKTVGDGSFAFGTDVEASGNTSFATGSSTKATGICSHTEGGLTTASGTNSHAEGLLTTANHRAQHVFGIHNFEDTSTASAAQNGTYIEIVGNGDLPYASRSNARTLDWNGNERLNGTLYVGCNADSSGGTEVATVDDIPDVSGFYTKPQTGIPASDLASGVIPDVSGFYTKPQTGIPASDLADGVIPDVPVQDVQVDGTSILNNGVANIPVADANNPGVVKINAPFGLAMRSSPNQNTIMISKATADTIKSGTQNYQPIVPSYQHYSAFYGLSKAAGVDLANETVTFGQYPVNAKNAIRTMIGAQENEIVDNISGTTATITGVDNHRYICGELATLSITAPQSGIIDVVFESGTTPTVLTVTGITFPEWFDPTTDIEADTTYEINVLDGRGVVSAWN